MANSDESANESADTSSENNSSTGGLDTDEASVDIIQNETSQETDLGNTSSEPDEIVSPAETQNDDSIDDPVPSEATEEPESD